MYNVVSSQLKMFKSYRGIQSKYWTTSEKRTTSEERKKAAVPKCPTFGGLTVCECLYCGLVADLATRFEGVSNSILQQCTMATTLHQSVE